MAFVLDCSVALAWIFPDEATEATHRLRESLIEGRAFAPALWPIEVANVLLVATRRGRVDPDEWEQLYTNLEALPIEIDPVSPSRVWERPSNSRTRTASPSTTPCTWNSPCGCGCRSPRSTGHWAKPDGWRGLKRRPTRKRPATVGCEISRTRMADFLTLDTPVADGRGSVFSTPLGATLRPGRCTLPQTTCRRKMVGLTARSESQTTPTQGSLWWGKLDYATASPATRPSHSVTHGCPRG